MKTFLKVILISALFFIPTLRAQATEDIAEELLTTRQNDEIVLNTQEDNIEVSPVKSSEEITSTNVTIDEEKEKTTSKNVKKWLFDFDFDDDNDGILDNTELDFEIFKMFDKQKEKKEDTLFGKIIHSDIRRTDIPSYLLQDDLTFEYKKGPISKIQAYGAYRGSISSLWVPEYSTEYDNLATQFGVYGSFKKPNYKFKLAVNAIPQTGTNYLERFISDAYIINTSIPNHQIVAGYSRVQTGVEGGTSTYILPFVARSQIARYFGNSRSMAVKLIGNYQYVDYNFSVGSAGRYFTSGLPGAEFNGWVNFKPLGNKSKKYGKVTIGGGFNGGHNHIDYSIGSVYLGYHHKKLWTNFEAAMADGYNGSKGPSANGACGYAATLGWKFNPHLQLIGRVDQFDPNRDANNDLRREYTVGVNWFIKGQALKVILNYVFCQNQNRPDGHKLIIATQVLI